MSSKILNLLKILDSIDFPIYVSDISTHKIIHINKKAKREFSDGIVGKTRDSVFKNTINNDEYFIKSILKKYDNDKYIDISILINKSATNVVDEFLNKIIINDENLNKYECMLTSIKRSFEDMKNKSEIYFVFQPKINVQTLKIMGYEVLTRWKHFIYKHISPDEFIPFLISINKIKEFDLFVFKSAFKFQEYLVRNNINQQCSINLSVASFNDINILKNICNLIDKFNISPESITIEILEHDGLGCKQNIKMLRDKGFKISMDDFGMGYSSLSRLYDFEVDELKIAKEFLIDFKENSKKQSILKFIANLSKELNIETVVEGVEKEGTFESIKAMGFLSSQGFFHSKPLNEFNYIEYSINNK